MPRLSDSMEEGTVAKWLVEVGAAIQKGQPLVEIDTDKATMEYEAEHAGVLLEIVVPAGETAPIGAPIARIGAPGESGAAETKPNRAAAPEQAAPAVAPLPGRARGNASPVARKLAEELGVDLETIAGSGPGGAVTRLDVERAVSTTSLPQKEDEPAGLRGETRVVEPTRLQNAVGRAMVAGHAAPDFAVEAEIDMTACIVLREELGQASDVRPSLNDLVVKAVALALREAPRMNASYTERGFELHSRINVGIAVAVDGGLVVPTILDADAKPLLEIAREARELASKVRDHTITPAELDGGTFTVTNLGMFGVRRFFPILNPPQAAILAIGDIGKRPAVDAHGAVVVRELMSAILVGDHRIVNGADAAVFLAGVRGLLEEPTQLTA
jgi:pyruvate dehydrogenase E2 component (dihydrolipoamide acetyltransferase)